MTNPVLAASVAAIDRNPPSPFGVRVTDAIELVPSALMAILDGPGTRRNIRALTTDLSNIEAGQHITAVFRSMLYGPYAVTGTAVRSEATGSLMLGGQPLDTSGGKGGPVPELLTLSAGTAPFAPDDSTTQPPESITQLNHGDVITARFEQHPYGVFHISGFALHAPVARCFVVGGGWFLTGADLRTPADRLITLTTARLAPDHRYRVPAPILRWPDPE